MKSYQEITNQVCRNYGLEHPVTIAVMTMIEKLVDPRIITDLLDAIELA